MKVAGHKNVSRGVETQQPRLFKPRRTPPKSNISANAVGRWLFTKSSLNSWIASQWPHPTLVASTSVTFVTCVTKGVKQSKQDEHKWLVNTSPGNQFCKTCLRIHGLNAAPHILWSKIPLQIHPFWDHNALVLGKLGPGQSGPGQCAVLDS